MKKNWAWLIVIAGLAIAFKQGVSVWRLWKSGEQVHLAQIQLQQEEAKNQALKKKLAEIDSPKFIEKEAREKLGYGKEGETILILPDQKEVDSSQLTVDSKPNWQKWWDLYIRI